VPERFNRRNPLFTLLIFPKMKEPVGGVERGKSAVASPAT